MEEEDVEEDGLVCEERIPPDKILSTADRDDTEVFDFEEISVDNKGRELELTVVERCGFWSLDKDGLDEVDLEGMENNTDGILDFDEDFNCLRCFVSSACNSAHRSSVLILTETNVEE